MGRVGAEPYLDVGLAGRHGSEVLEDLVVEAHLEVLEPPDRLVVHAVMEPLQPDQLLAVLYLGEEHLLAPPIHRAPPTHRAHS